MHKLNGRKKVQKMRSKNRCNKKSNLDKYTHIQRERGRGKGGGCSEKQIKRSMKLYENSAADETRGCVCTAVWQG